LNKKPIQRKIKISNARKTPTLSDERVPTQDELNRVLYADTTPLRTRASIALMAFAGVRPEVQGNYYGEDGLKIKDFPELKIDGKKVDCSIIPTLICVRVELSKTKKRYLTFLAEEGCEILKQYLERRIQDGEQLSPEAGIIVTSPLQAKRSANFKKEDSSNFLTTHKVSDNIRDAMRASGLPLRPYVFRSYFDTNLMLAESKGLLSHSYQQFWMGHSGDIEATYTTHKGRLPDSVITDMRESYKRLQNILQTRPRQAEEQSEEKLRNALREQLLAMAGFSSQEIQKMHPENMTNEEVQRAIRERLFGLMANNGNSQRVVSVDRVSELIERGWEFVSELSTGQVVMKVPSF
jgi:integrase